MSETIIRPGRPATTKRGKLLKKAADILRGHWGTGDLTYTEDDGTIRYCMLGAILIADGWERDKIYAPDTDDPYDRAFEIIGYDSNDDPRNESISGRYNPYAWNDRLDDEDKVVGVLEELARTGMSWDEYIRTVEPDEKMV